MCIFVSIAEGQSSRTAEDHYNRAAASYKKGDIEGAIADFTRAIEISSRLAEAYYNRGFARRGKEDKDGALRDFDRALALDPSLKVELEQRIELVKQWRQKK